MKRLFITLLIGLSAVTVFGQEKKEDMSQRFFDAKIKEFVYELDITDAQKPDFVAVYKRYNDEMRSVVGKPERPETRPETAEAAAAAVKSRLENQNKAQQIRIKYVDDFAKVLEPAQLMRLYDVEAQIQHKLMDRKNGHGGKGHGKGYGRGPGNGPGNGSGAVSGQRPGPGGAPGFRPAPDDND